MSGRPQVQIVHTETEFEARVLDAAGDVVWSTGCFASRDEALAAVRLLAVVTAGRPVGASDVDLQAVKR